MATDVEDGTVVCNIGIGQLLGLRQLLCNGLVLEEVDTLLVGEILRSNISIRVAKSIFVGTIPLRCIHQQAG